MSGLCLLVQPIHPGGIRILEEAGLEVRQASAATMDVVAREAKDAVAAITRNAGFNRAAMEAAPRLAVLGNHGTGYDPVDVGYAREIGLPIVYTPTANVQSVAEHAIAQMIAIIKRVRECDRAVRAGDFDYRYARDFHELAGKRLLIFGFGKIGRRTAEIARLAFGMRVEVYSPSADDGDIRAAGCVPVGDLGRALAEADIVSLHQRLTPQTRGMFDRERLRAMKKGAVLVNTARGALVVPEALIEAVDGGHLRGAAMDVFETEPLPAGHPYTACDGILLSPHTGGATEEALERTAVETARQVVDVLAGRRPEYLVDPDVWARRRVAAPA
ncbi:hydroxyacid dehydrogenase [Rhodoplanes sp. TEM]|uniref:Hydroxyacid dehydrogenase n=1 Tax=Rhodoplanes tepidamans TaxID=200616 RepID=A0ABT5JGI4_RHOTP|nr:MULTISPECIES: hydroxyacid dehydrogenase [Rhodoplanes]MDC7788523.1 hydroxyacid dehydrogenase [Rhodoplanes tepidamans]MDC7985122.1 hydroxyacid dehydrogenase [Rhodoplanes sp. TEM]MDQ0353418.1 D-3-phosphoglycerate dehydrogenase [Rhodoplanes tepidamans]